MTAQSVTSAGRRVSLEPQSLLVEVRGTVGGFAVEKEIFWDEVQTVYTWKAPDWNVIVAGSVLPALVFAALALFWDWPRVLVAGLGVLTAAIIGLCLFRGFRERPRQWVKIESSQGPVSIYLFGEGFLPALLSRLELVPDDAGPHA